MTKKNTFSKVHTAFTSYLDHEEEAPETAKQPTDEPEAVKTENNTETAKETATAPETASADQIRKASGASAAKPGEREQQLKAELEEEQRKRGLKTRRLQLVLTQETYDKAKAKADKSRLSMNAYISKLINDDTMKGD